MAPVNTMSQVQELPDDLRLGLEEAAREKNQAQLSNNQRQGVADISNAAVFSVPHFQEGGNQEETGYGDFSVRDIFGSADEYDKATAEARQTVEQSRPGVVSSESAMGEDISVRDLLSSDAAYHAATGAAREDVEQSYKISQEEQAAAEKTQDTRNKVSIVRSIGDRLAALQKRHSA